MTMFLRNIREEIASLESEGLGGQLIFGESTYKNSQNKEQPMVKYEKQ